MKPLLVFGLSAMLLPMLMSGPAGAKPVYKCEEKGQMTYTDQPCSAGARATELPGLIVTVPPTRAEQDLARAHDARVERMRSERDRDDAQWLKEYGNRTDRAARVRKAILEHKVIKSMTFDEVKQALGEPDRVDSGDSYGTDKATWTYLSGGQQRTVNFKNGEVISTTRKGQRRR